MFLLAYFLDAVANLLHMLLMAAIFVIIIRSVLSWVSPDPYNPVVRTVIQLSEPLLFPVRKRLPYLGGMDISPMVVILVLMFLDNFVVPSLHRMASNLL